MGLFLSESIGLFVVAIRAVSAATLATVTAFQVILFGKNDEAFIGVIVISFF
jgi:hypothetical protein